MPIAITRPISPFLNRCELSYQSRIEIDIQLAHQQHTSYERALESLGCTLRRLPAEPELPDSVFVEDTALILNELAVITRPGAESRRGEIPSVAAALQEYRRLEYITAPGTLDGGDILTIGRTVYVGASQRSNQSGVQQLALLLAPNGYQVRPVEVSRCLHLKSAVTLVEPNTVLINPDFVDRSAFARVGFIDVHPSEPDAANALLVNETIVYPANFALTRSRLETAGIKVLTVDVSELQKAEGAVTCCSLIIPE